MTKLSPDAHADRHLLQVFYRACQSEGGTADEINLRGIRAVLSDAALAQPKPQGPTNERLTWLWNHLQVSRRQLMALRGENCLDDTDYQQFARSVLKQWGRPAIEPVPGVEGGDA